MELIGGIFYIQNSVKSCAKILLGNVMFLFQLLLFVAAFIKNYIRFLINFPSDFVLVKL